MTTDYECIDCPQILSDVKEGERVVTVPSDQSEPLYCPWCGNQTLVEGGVDWESLSNDIE